MSLNAEKTPPLRFRADGKTEAQLNVDTWHVSAGPSGEPSSLHSSVESSSEVKEDSEEKERSAESDDEGHTSGTTRTRFISDYRPEDT